MPRTVEPAQPALAGFEAVQTPELADELPRFAINGTLAEAVHIRHSADGAVLLEALVVQRVAHHPRALPVLGCHRLADRGSFALTHQAALAHAARLPAGADVMVIGRGLEVRTYQGQEVLRFIHCDAIALTGSLIEPHQPGGTAP